MCLLSISLFLSRLIWTIHCCAQTYHMNLIVAQIRIGSICLCGPQLQREVGSLGADCGTEGSLPSSDFGALDL